MKNQKGFSLLMVILVTIFVLILMGVGYFAYLQYKSSKEQISQTGTDSQQITNRKTYSNENYGFELKYPEGTQISSADVVVNDVVLGNINRGKKITFQIDSSRVLIVEVLKQNPHCPDTTAAGDLPNRTIGGVNFMGITGHQIGEEVKDNSYAPYAQANEYCATVNGSEYKIIPAVIQIKGNENPPENDSILNQMLSSFKILK